MMQQQQQQQQQQQPQLEPAAAPIAVAVTSADVQRHFGDRTDATDGLLGSHSLLNFLAGALPSGAGAEKVYDTIGAGRAYHTVWPEAALNAVHDALDAAHREAQGASAGVDLRAEVETYHAPLKQALGSRGGPKSAARAVGNLVFRAAREVLASQAQAEAQAAADAQAEAVMAGAGAAEVVAEGQAQPHNPMDLFAQAQVQQAQQMQQQQQSPPAIAPAAAVGMD